MLVKYLSPFRTARPSAYHFRLVRPPTYYLRTTLATRSSSFLRDRCAFHSDIPKSESKDPPETKDPPKLEANGGPKSEAKDAPQSEAKDAPQSEAKDGPKSESKDGSKSESEGPKSDAEKPDYKTIILTSVATVSFAGTGLAIWRWLISPYEQKVRFENQLKNEANNRFLEEKQNEEAVFQAIEQGSYPRSEDNLVTREDIIVKMQECFAKPYDYHLVVGEHGTGKTTVVTQAANKVGKGIVYIQGYAQLNDFCDAFAKALRWNYDMAVKNNLDPYDKLKHAMAAFRHSAAKYKAKYNKPAVLILDDISKLTIKYPEVIEMLQDIAKLVADNKEFTFVFVTSKGTIPRLMSNNSSWSRASPPLLIDDFTEDEALKYLRNILLLKGEKEEKEKAEKEREEKVKQFYQLFGGRIKLLQTYGMMSNYGVSLEEIRKLAFRKVDGYFCEAKITKGAKYESIGNKIIQELVKMKRQGKTMTIDDFRGLTNDINITEELLQANVFSLNAVDGTVTFQSRLVEIYVMENRLKFGLK